jgi:phosphoheptose isomerase
LALYIPSMQVMKNVWTACFSDAQKCLQEFTSQPQNLELCERFSQILIETMQNGGNLFTCGNGGSQCDAMHFAEELTGRYRKNRRPLSQEPPAARRFGAG